MKKSHKKYILTIETTSNICGVSLIAENNVIYENDLDKGLNHSITLFDNINNALKNINISDLKKIKISNGPGSFTGIRIGISAALGLSEPKNIILEYVDTLDSLAYNVKNKNDYIISMIDAKNDRIYLAIYNSKSLYKMSRDIVIDIETFIELINKYFYNQKITFSFVGDGAVNYKNQFKNNLKINYKIYENNSTLKSSSLAYIDGIVSKYPVINYILASKAEREKNGKC